MKIEAVKAIEGLELITPDVFRDHRGENVEIWNKLDSKPGIEFVQDNISVSHWNVLRGLHGDFETWKLVQCLHGVIWMAIVDCRRKSPTYGAIWQDTMSWRSQGQLLIPPGCANGHYCLTESCIFHYKMSQYYFPNKQFTLKWNTPGIRWPLVETTPILSDRDKGGLPLVAIGL
jgi:dTDP-4-dehydrorhamnose 3,5-epimerase